MDDCVRRYIFTLLFMLNPFLLAHVLQHIDALTHILNYNLHITTEFVPVFVYLFQSFCNLFFLGPVSSTLCIITYSLSSSTESFVFTMQRNVAELIQTVKSCRMDLLKQDVSLLFKVLPYPLLILPLVFFKRGVKSSPEISDSIQYPVQFSYANSSVALNINISLSKAAEYICDFLSIT